jgi:hypothetical protein
MQIYTLIQAQPKRLISELIYLQMFHTNDLKASRHGFAYANVQAAVEYLQQQYGCASHISCVWQS